MLWNFFNKENILISIKYELQRGRQYRYLRSTNSTRTYIFEHIEYQQKKAENPQLLRKTEGHTIIIFLRIYSQYNMFLWEVHKLSPLTLTRSSERKPFTLINSQMFTNKLLLVYVLCCPELTA
jgi:hypothetical protein